MNQVTVQNIGGCTIYKEVKSHGRVCDQELFIESESIIYLLEGAVTEDTGYCLFIFPPVWTISSSAAYCALGCVVASIPVTLAPLNVPSVPL